jgi:O-antigen/teichoic acid export membrane protein
MTDTRSNQDTVVTDTDTTATDTTTAANGTADTATAANGNGGSAVDIQSRAMRGASFLFGREGIGAVVRLIGIIITVREIGPSDYGLYTAAAAFVTVVVTICQMGAEIYLIRVKDEPSERQNNEIFTLLLVTSVAATVISIGLSFALLPLLRPVGVALPLRVLLLCVPINVLWAPAQAYIERRFDYKKMGILELGGDCVLYATAVPLAILHFGAWSLVIGYFAWQSFLLIGSLILSGLRPRWAWSTATAKDVIRHGTSYSTASLFVNLPPVVNALVVGSFVGAAGVGYVSFARNLVQTVGFAKRCAYRLGIVTMSQINRDDPSKFRQGLERGSFLLTLALGVPFAVFGLAAHWIIPDLFGHEWAASLPIYCLLSLAFVLGTVAQIEASLFYALGRNMTVAVTAALQVIILAVLSVVFVKLWGVNGFGIASVLALAAFFYGDHQMRKLATYSMKLTLLISLILSPSLFLPMLPPPVGLLLLVPWVLFLVITPLRVQIPQLWRSLIHSLRGSAVLA